MWTKMLRAGILAVFLTTSLFPPVYAQSEAAQDFILDVTVDGTDLASLDVIALDVERTTQIGLRIREAREDLTLRTLYVVPTIAGQQVTAFQRPLDNIIVPAGQDFTTQLDVNLGEYLAWDGKPLATGLYEVHVKLDYQAAAGGLRTLDLPLEVKIPGNPLTTPPGIAAVAFAAAAAVAAMSLVSSVATPAISMGMQLPSTVHAFASDQLKNFSWGGLEPLARERSIAAMTEAAKKRIKKGTCPLCGGKMKHGMCPQCGKSAAELRAQYVDTMKDLMVDAGEALTGNTMMTIGSLARELGITPHLATEFLAVARQAKLVRVKGLGAKVGAKALMTGINMGISAILLITFGGFARLTPTILVVIVVLTFVGPLAITRYLAWRTRRAARQLETTTAVAG